jgi:hypothetical protein
LLCQWNCLKHLGCLEDTVDMENETLQPPKACDLVLYLSSLKNWHFSSFGGVIITPKPLCSPLKHCVLRRILALMGTW